jgi:hypothetical protein
LQFYENHLKNRPFWALEAPFWGQNHRFKERLIDPTCKKTFSSVEQIKKRLAIRSTRPKVIKDEEDYQLHEGQTGYGVAAQNLHQWHLENKPTELHIS